jgi:hypothetical protein
MTRQQAHPSEQRLGWLQRHHRTAAPSPVIRLHRPLAHRLESEVQQARPAYVAYDDGGWPLFFDLIGQIFLAAGLMSGLLLVVMGYGGYTGWSAISVIVGMVILGCVRVAERRS